MGKEIIIQVQETQRVPDRNNPRQNTPRHVLIILTKVKHKEQMLKAKREKKQITHKGIPIRITVDLSIETLQDRREGGHGNPLQYSCLENPHWPKSLAGYSPLGCRELDMTE